MEVESYTYAFDWLGGGFSERDVLFAGKKIGKKL